MADNEDDSAATRTITVSEPPGVAVKSPASACTQPGDSVPPPPAAGITQPADKVSTAASEQGSQAGSGTGGSPSGQSEAAGSGAQMADLLQSCPEDQSILLGSEFTDLANTTIIYVQPDGSLVEGSGLTAEEQQVLLDQLTKQHIVQVSDSEAAQLLQQNQVRTLPVHNTALDPSQLQQVINQVTKSQNQVQVPQQQVQVQVQVQQSPKQQKPVQVPQQILKTSTQTHASQQLKSVAQQVAMQTSSSVQVVQKKVGHSSVWFSPALYEPPSPHVAQTDPTLWFCLFRTSSRVS